MNARVQKVGIERAVLEVSLENCRTGQIGNDIFIVLKNTLTSIISFPRFYIMQRIFKTAGRVYDIL